MLTHLRLYRRLWPLWPTYRVSTAFDLPAPFHSVYPRCAVTPRSAPRRAHRQTARCRPYAARVPSPPSWFTGKSLLRNEEFPYFADFYGSGQLGWAEDWRLS